MTGKRFLTVDQAAERLGLSVNRVQKLAAWGEVPHRRLPGRKALLFSEEELALYEEGARLERISLDERFGRWVRPIPLD